MVSFVLLLCLQFLFCETVFAEGRPSPSPGTAPAVPSAASAIEEAQGLFIAKNRTGALSQVTRAMEGTPPTAKGRARLGEVLHQMSRTFFTDKGQKLYESGQTALFDNPDLALARFRDALLLEDNNVLILISVAHVQIAKHDCNGALQTVRAARALSQFLSEPALLELRGLLCLGNFETFREKVKALPTIEKQLDYFVQFLTAQDLMQQKLWKRANDLLLKVAEEQPRFPEAFYWLHRTRTELGEAEGSFAKKYLALCKSVSVRDRKQFVLEPRLCGAVKEVEDDLAKKTRDL